MKKIKINMTMRLKLIASFSGVLLIFLSVALFNLNQVNQIKNHMTDQNDKVELKVLALELKNMVQEMNIIASGLEISKKPEYIEKYNAKRKPYNDFIQKIGDTASTTDQKKWRSQLIQLSVDYINNFDSAAKMVQDPNLKPTDLQINLLYLYNESQDLKDKIFDLVDKFYVTYADSAEQAIAQSTKALNESSKVMLIAFAIVVIVTIIIAFLIISSFTRPIKILQNAVSLIAAGDLSHTINSKSNDELGMLSNSFDHMIIQVRQMLSATMQIASSLSEHSHEFHRFSKLTASANTDILKAITEISTGADEQAMKTEQSSIIIAELEAEIRDISAYTYEMKRSSEEAASGTLQGTASVRALKSSSDQSQAVLQKVDAAMLSLSDSSKQIGAIIHSITEISTQTNVLALNAAIEAARAGAHGRGFSVIADEVRQLSQQTNDSSKTIGGIIQALQKQIKELQSSLIEARESAVTQNHRVADTLGSFEGIEQSMKGIIGQIEQIHVKIEQVQSKNDRLVNSVQFVAAIAQETAAGVEEVSSTSIQQDASIRRIAEESDDILELAQQLFAEISKFQISETAEMNDQESFELQSEPTLVKNEAQFEVFEDNQVSHKPQHNELLAVTNEGLTTNNSNEVLSQTEMDLFEVELERSATQTLPDDQNKSESKKDESKKENKEPALVGKD
jgi:methyl-accepting chemotaxis protein